MQPQFRRRRRSRVDSMTVNRAKLGCPDSRRHSASPPETAMCFWEVIDLGSLPMIHCETSHYPITQCSNFMHKYSCSGWQEMLSYVLSITYHFTRVRRSITTIQHSIGS